MQATGKSVGHYRIVSLLGDGLLGEVYLAEHDTIGRKAAIKIVHPALSSRAEAVARFFATVGAINHPGAVEVYACEAAHELGACVVMEHLEGESLAARLSHCDPLPLTQVVRIVREVASVLDAAHRADHIHGALKPENVFLLPDDQVKVLDFGGYHLAQNDPGLMAIEFLAPEQCEGRPPGPPADVYALGTITFLLLAGRPPFVAADMASLIQMQRQAPPPPLPIRYADLPSRVEALIAVALAKDPAQRPPSATALAEALVEAATPALQFTIKSSCDGEEQHGSIGAGSRGDTTGSRSGSGDVQTVRLERRPADDTDEDSSAPLRTRCPHCCQYLLKPATISGTEVDVCPQCHGVWFDEGEVLSVLNERATEQPSEGDGDSLDIVGERLESTELRCPACGEPLVSYSFADLEGLQLDICELCEGFWLDDGELALLQRQRWQQNTRLRIRRGRREDHSD